MKMNLFLMIKNFNQYHYRMTLFLYNTNPPSHSLAWQHHLRSCLLVLRTIQQPLIPLFLRLFQRMNRRERQLCILILLLRFQIHRMLLLKTSEIGYVKQIRGRFHAYHKLGILGVYNFDFKKQKPFCKGFC